MAPRLLREVGSALDRATVRMMGRVFQPRRWPREARERDPAELVALAETFYARADTRARYFAAPPPPRVTETARERLPAGAVVDLRFPSTFEPLLPSAAAEYLAHVENRTMHARHLRHDRPAPTLVCLHGWGGGAYWLEERAFAARWFYRAGFDVVLATLPFHGLRTPAAAHFSGALFPTANVFRTNEAFAHALWDLRALFGWLRRRGAAEVGIVGMSLGGYVSALLASVESGCDFVIPVMPAVSFADLMWDHGAGTAGRRKAERHGITRQTLARVFAVHAPLEHRPLVPHARRFIIAGLGDRITPPAQARALWEHWERPRIEWFEGAHVLPLGRRAALRAVSGFLTPTAAHNHRSHE
jgi:dienelactone hydrolase